MSNFGDPLVLPELSTLVWLKGSPTDLTHDIQLTLLIQPNCPGCHIHALPLANKLAESKRDFDLYCICTAFEDFEYNTEESARMLLNGQHVGASKERLGEKAQHIPTMPVAHDIVVPIDQASTALKDMALEASKANARRQMAGRVSPSVLERNLSQVGYEVLPKKIAETFYRVRALGTPCWVLHTVDGEVLDSKFGQVSETELVEWITRNSERS